VLWDGGSAVSYERINEWQRAWARFRTGDSAIDYVRVAGSIADPILLNAGQTGRRGRLWWRVLLDQYGAADVVIPIARLDRQYPGGPVTGTFTARYGPDNFLIGSFSLRASNDSAIPQMLDQATQRIDQLYTQALNDGRLRPDPSLIIEEPVDPNALEIENAADLPVETLDMPAVCRHDAQLRDPVRHARRRIGRAGRGRRAFRRGRAFGRDQQPRARRHVGHAGELRRHRRFAARRAGRQGI